jgi:hypothetical protein
MDVAPIDALAAPVFNPLLGFSTLSAPEITVEEYQIKQGNWFFDRQVVKRGAISGFSAQRGVTYSDSDFWRWTISALTGGLESSLGSASYRRTFVLIHFFARNPTGINLEEATQARNFGPFEFAIRVPARAYLLKGCIPTKWRSGNNFDAMDGSVSIAELDFSCEMVEEISLASNATLGLAASLATSIVGATTANGSSKQASNPNSNPEVVNQPVVL